MRISRFGLIIIIVLCADFIQAQNFNYFVKFTDKNNSSFSVSSPEEFLSSRAISRRSRHQIAITEEDLPVNSTYILGVEAVGNVSVRQSSKWFNGVLIQATSGDAELVKLLPYVIDIEFIAEGNVGGRVAKQLEVEAKSVFESDTLFQSEILGISEMRADGYQGQDMLIAVMDGGFSGMTDVPPFSALYTGNRVLMSYNFITRTNDVYQYTDHGTKVMSLLAAVQESPDYGGSVPEADFLLFVTEDINFEYRLEEYRWLVAAEKADSAGANVISSSLGYNTFDDASMNYSKSELDGLTAVITKAAQRAAEKGILVVTSGGNTGLSDPWEAVLFPGDIIDGLAVGSITSNSTPSVFSPRGSTADGRIKPDVMAYGSGTYVINKLGNIVTASGTSFAAPQVAGLATGIWQAHPNVRLKDLIEAFKSSSSNAGTPNTDIGYGIPSYQALYNYLAAEESAHWFSVYPNPVVESEYLKIRIFDPLENSKVHIKMFDRLGKPLTDDNLNISWQNNMYFLELASLPRGIYILNLQSSKNFSRVKILKL